MKIFNEIKVTRTPTLRRIMVNRNLSPDNLEGTSIKIQIDYDIFDVFFHHISDIYSDEYEEFSIDRFYNYVKSDILSVLIYSEIVDATLGGEYIYYKSLAELPYIILQDDIGRPIDISSVQSGDIGRVIIDVTPGVTWAEANAAADKDWTVEMDYF